MKYVATISKISEAPKVGQYKPTKIDIKKQQAQILIIACDGTFTIKVKDDLIKLRGKGVKQPYNNKNLYEVTKKALDKISAEYKVISDF